MDSVGDIENEEAYVEDEVENVPSHDEQIEQDGVYIQESMVMAYLSNPWIWLGIAIIIYYFYQRLDVNLRYTDWQQKREHAAESAHMKKDPDFYRDRMEAMERARQRQQDAHDIAAAELAEKEKTKEEERRAQKIEQLENLVSGKGYNNKSKRNCTGAADNAAKTSKPNATKSNFRADYTPLMGGGGESGYRPERRGFSAGGGG